MDWRRLGLLSLGLGPLLAGCAGMQLKQTDIVFEDPVRRLDIREVQPNEVEKAGVVLRLNAATGGVRKSREENVTFAQIKQDRGGELHVAKEQTETFKPGSRPDSYLDLSRSTFAGEPGELIEEYELTTRGEMIRFIRGSHDSKVGKFRIVDWKRTPMFPEGAVKIGDTWTFREVMDMRVDSWLVKEKDPQPYVINAACTLVGFADIRGTRVAVVKVQASQTKQERLKVLFKALDMDIQVSIEEFNYLDYAQGVIVARFSRTHSHSVVHGYDIQDEEKGQSIYFLQ